MKKPSKPKRPTDRKIAASGAPSAKTSTKARAPKSAKAVAPQAAKPVATVKKVAPIRLTQAESTLLKAIKVAQEQDRYDIISEADPKIVQALIDKDRIRVRKIERTRLSGSRFTHEEARRAILAVRRRRTQPSQPSEE